MIAIGRRQNLAKFAVWLLLPPSSVFLRSRLIVLLLLGAAGNQRRRGKTMEATLAFRKTL